MFDQETIVAPAAPQTTNFPIIAKAALAAYYRERKASGKDVWEQSVPSGQYKIRPFAQPAVVTGAYPKKASARAKELAAHLGCDIVGDIANVHVQLLDSSNRVVAKATLTEVADAIGLNEDNVETLFLQPYTMSATKGDIENKVSRIWTIS